MNSQMIPLNEDRDARRWAKEFNGVLIKQGKEPLDEGWLIGWFANAIMCGYDTGRRELRRSSSWPRWWRI